MLAQAMLLAAGDVDEGTRMASRFYELAGGELRFMAGTSTTLASCIGWSGSDQALVTNALVRLATLLRLDGPPYLIPALSAERASGLITTEYAPEKHISTVQ